MPRIISKAGRIAYHGLPKYTFERHGSNNSAWTTNHSLLDESTLEEYLKVYRERTKWLAVEFPGKTAEWQYFEWSFMISMLEKITRLGIKGCERHIDDMKQELSSHRDVFINCDHIQGFEKEWMDLYI
jgi:hypothetical protein